jgi:hypothetical protein
MIDIKIFTKPAREITVREALKKPLSELVFASFLGKTSMYYFSDHTRLLLDDDVTELKLIPKYGVDKVMKQIELLTAKFSDRINSSEFFLIQEKGHNAQLAINKKLYKNGYKLLFVFNEDSINASQTVAQKQHLFNTSNPKKMVEIVKELRPSVHQCSPSLRKYLEA